MIGIGYDFAGDYPTLLTDTSFQNWSTLWNGSTEFPTNLNNDGSNTFVLVRNRPGRTEAEPTHPDGLRWGKDVRHDAELIVVGDPPQWDQWGDGGIDRGEEDGQGGLTLDLKGVSTPDDVSDDLEVVDEVSYEHGAGWEYDMDGRHVDAGSELPGLPERRVHALDDPQGFNPDILTRVDYRTKGEGWTPASGGVGELPGGNNWQDTATEQWIRGESRSCFFNCPGAGELPQIFFDHPANDNPDAIQPYETNVPLWLDDGEEPDYDFSQTNTYQVMAGRVNPMAVVFVPGDADRDGDCDVEDLAKVASVFGDDDWIFSNSYGTAPEGDSGDPAAQIRPWDVDATGADGIEPSDVQWTLNFQGDTTGRVVGVQYDSETPSAVGVYLNDNTGVTVTVSATAEVPGGYGLGEVPAGAMFELVVSAEVSGGANVTAGQENGVMQFVHDVVIDTGGVVAVTSVTPVAPFATTRMELQELQGVDGDLGVVSINGYTMSFAGGLSGAVELYRVGLRARAAGSASVRVQPAAFDKFAASTPHGVKVGHTASMGNPAGTSYPVGLALTVVSGPTGDLDHDGDVDLDDYAGLADCLSGPSVVPAPTLPTTPADCQAAFDFDIDTDVDLFDVLSFQRVFGS